MKPIDGRVTLWRILVEKPLPKEKTAGGIILSQSTQEADEAFTCVGKVLQLGPLAYLSRPNEGLNFNHMPAQAKAKVGGYVLFARHAGQPLKFSDPNDKRVWIILNDTDVLMTDIQAPEAFKSYV